MPQHPLLYVQPSLYMFTYAYTGASIITHTHWYLCLCSHSFAHNLLIHHCISTPELAYIHVHASARTHACTQAHTHTHTYTHRQRQTRAHTHTHHTIHTQTHTHTLFFPSLSLGDWLFYNLHVHHFVLLFFSRTCQASFIVLLQVLEGMIILYYTRIKIR